MTLVNSLAQWQVATGKVAPGVQRVFLDTLGLVSEGKAHLVYGADYRDGKPCLVNAVAQMTTAGGGSGVPSAVFGEVVSAFDSINAKLEESKVNDGTGYVSALAADILIRNFGEVKPMNFEAGISDDVPESQITSYSPEISDEAMAREIMNMMSAPPVEELHTDEYTRQHVEYRSAGVE